jgi:hypothetical protein
VHCPPACVRAFSRLVIAKREDQQQARQLDETCKKSDFRFIQVWFVYAVEATVASAKKIFPDLRHPTSDYDA